MIAIMWLLMASTYSALRGLPCDKSLEVAKTPNIYDSSRPKKPSMRTQVHMVPHRRKRMLDEAFVIRGPGLLDANICPQLPT